MFLKIHLLPGAVPEMFAQITQTGIITQADRYGLMAAILQENLGEEDRAAIDRLIYAVCRGRLSLTDELSIVMWLEGSANLSFAYFKD